MEDWNWIYSPIELGKCLLLDARIFRARKCKSIQSLIYIRASNSNKQNLRMNNVFSYIPNPMKPIWMCFYNKALLRFDRNTQCLFRIANQIFPPRTLRKRIKFRSAKFNLLLRISNLPLTILLSESAQCFGRGIYFFNVDHTRLGNRVWESVHMYSKNTNGILN